MAVTGTRARAQFPSAARLGARRVRGAGLFSTLCVLLVLVGGAWLSIKLLPLYLEFRTIRSIVASLPAETVERQPLPAVYDALEKRFLVNNLQDIKPREVIAYGKGPGPVALIIDYERREPLFLNIDVVIRFNHRFDYR
jgi:hypothetical protein